MYLRPEWSSIGYIGNAESTSRRENPFLRYRLARRTGSGGVDKVEGRIEGVHEGETVKVEHFRGVGHVYLAASGRGCFRTHSSPAWKSSPCWKGKPDSPHPLPIVYRSLSLYRAMTQPHVQSAASRESTSSGVNISRHLANRMLRPLDMVDMRDEAMSECAGSPKHIAAISGKSSFFIVVL